MQFSDTVTNSGIVQRVRNKMRVDSNQWSTQKIANSCNDYLETVLIKLAKNDKRFNPDDANHTKLPIGTTNIVASQTDYSFLTDEQGNRILAVTRIEIKDSNGNWTKLAELDEGEEPLALDTVIVSGQPTGYYKIADNIIRLNRIPTASVTAGLKYYFLRAPSYFVATDTTKEPGVPAILHSGFVTYAAYDGAVTLGLGNVNALSVDLQREEQKLNEYIMSRNLDITRRMTGGYQNNR